MSLGDVAPAAAIKDDPCWAVRFISIPTHLVYVVRYALDISEAESPLERVSGAGAVRIKGIAIHKARPRFPSLSFPSQNHQSYRNPERDLHRIPLFF